MLNLRTNSVFGDSTYLLKRKERGRSLPLLRRIAYSDCRPAFSAHTRTPTEAAVIAIMRTTAKPSPITSVTHKIINAKEATAKASKTPIFIFCALSIAPLFNNKTPPCEEFLYLQKISSLQNAFAVLHGHSTHVLKSGRIPTLD